MLDDNNSDKMYLKNFANLYKDLDLDRDGSITPFEVGSYFTRNEYIICRPIREEVLTYLKNKIEESFRPLYRFLDANKNKQITNEDDNVLFESLDTNKDKVTDKKELAAGTDELFTKMCVT